MLIFFIFSNSADSTYNSAIINTNVIVSSSGEITWLSHGIYKSSCDIDVEYFPFDVQICKLMWASWTYDGQSVRSLILKKIIQDLKKSFLLIEQMISVKLVQIVFVSFISFKKVKQTIYSWYETRYRISWKIMLLSVFQRDIRDSQISRKNDAY